MIGQCLKAYREKFGIGLRELAREFGFSPSTLSRIESGKPCDATIQLQLVNWLFGETKTELPVNQEVLFKNLSPGRILSQVEKRISLLEGKFSEHEKNHTDVS